MNEWERGGRGKGKNVGRFQRFFISCSGERSLVAVEWWEMSARMDDDLSDELMATTEEERIYDTYLLCAEYIHKCAH